MDPYYLTEEWISLRRRVVQRDGGVCFYCGDRGHQADHVVPRSYGGRDLVSNLVCCCARCNKLLLSKYFITKSEKKRYIRAMLSGKPYKPTVSAKRNLRVGMSKWEYQAAQKSWPTPYERQMQADAELKKWMDSLDAPP